MSDLLQVRFTQAELQLLLHALEIETLPGLATDLLAGFNEEQRKTALIIADQTLRARRFVMWNSDSQHVINPTLASLLLDYARPSATLFVDTRLPTGRAMPFLYVSGKQGIYEQCQPEPDVMQFRVLASSTELEQRLSPHLPDENPPQSERWQGQIKQRLLNEVLRLVGQNEDAARRSLATVLSLELASALASAYHAPLVVQYIACWHSIPTQIHAEPQTALTILQGATHAFLLWVMEPELGETSLVRIDPFSTNMLRHYIQQIVSSFVRVNTQIAIQR